MILPAKYFIAIIITTGITSGWGLYGDLMVEKFHLKKVFRTFVLNAVALIFLYSINFTQNVIVLIGTTIAIERLITELYKLFIREESQNKYKIPSNLNIRINIHIKRLCGILLILISLLLVRDLNIEGMPQLLILFSGIFTSIGGMLKDAPFEGFEIKKFPRSLIVSGLIGIILIYKFPVITNKQLMFTMLGIERVFTETYKKIINNRIPGKFKSESTINQDWNKNRKSLLIPYFTMIFLTIILYLIEKA